MSYSAELHGRLPPFTARFKQMNVKTQRLPINKIIWTSFDYTTGPIFNSSITLNYPEADEYHESAVSSTTADVSSDPDQYEDIDDPQISLLLVDDTIPPESSDDEFGSSCPTTRDNNSNENLPTSSVVSPVGNMDVSAVDSGISTNHSQYSEMNNEMSSSQYPFGATMLTINQLRDDHFSPSAPQPYVSQPCATTPNPFVKPNSPDDVSDHNSLMNILSDSSCSEDTSDEEFITSHAMSEQITGEYISLNPIVMKMCAVPSRHLFYVSYISWPGVKYGPAMTAVTILMDFGDQDYYYLNKTIIDNYFDNFLMLFTWRIERFFPHDRQCIFMMTEMDHLIHILSGVEPLIHNNLQLRQTLFGSGLKHENQFVQKCIAGAIMSRGHTYVLGVDDFEYGRKLIATLSLFLFEEKRVMCSSLCASRISHHTLLQVVPDKEKKQLLQQVALCEWPACVIDIRKQSVATTGMYWDHLKASKKYKIDALNSVLEKSELPPPPSSTKWIRVHHLPRMIRDSLDMIDDVPLGTVIQQITQSMRNQAVAFIQAVEEASTPSATDKTNPYSAKFSVQRVFDACNITSFEAKGIVMANAEILKPTLGQFIAENAIDAK
uniref:MULE domain-containing protein n=1 Tax=Panagrellus redivivus TaxID=6233 RepID=A0A7E4WDV9_PANRE